MSHLHPPHLHFNKLKKRARAAIAIGTGSHRPAAKARKGLAAILYKLRDVHVNRTPSSPPSPLPSPSPSTPHYRQLCYPPAPSTCPWPSCRHPRTSSFRARPEDIAAAAATVYRTANAVYDTPSEHFLRRPSLDEAWCGERSSVSVSGQAAVDREPEAEESNKEVQLRETAVVCGVRSARLFFEPAGAEFLSPKQADALICEAEATAMEATAKNDDATTVPAGEKEMTPPAVPADLKSGAVVVTMESEDPYGDFRASMAEMVAAHGLRDWEGLEELLAWYLKLNAKGVHAVIVGAFVDLLVGLATPPSPSPPSQSPSSSCITFEDYSSATFDEEDKS
uniref:Uncharacterized protein n=1 Tax=Avena sativa TaxID=4498 RepID=A0ACD5UR92_AVESA